MGFRLGTIDDHAVLVTDKGAYDLERHSKGSFSSDSMEAVARYTKLHEVSAGLSGDPDVALDAANFGPCVTRPQKSLGIGLNYRDHAEESQMDIPETPLVFSKIPSCIVGPTDDIIVYGPTTDWEAELVVCMGTTARDIPVDKAWDHVAGLTCGQDISERTTQFLTRPPQFDLGKSFDTYGPIGPYIVSVDQFENPDNIGLTCDLNGERKQDARTTDLIFDVPALVSYISGICTLEPGDLIFTGTPSGVGFTTGTFLKDGDVVTTAIEGIGTMTNRCIAPKK